ncbi:hypothetical protein AALB51_14930 [Lachnospiraceae bacterium 62-26]
MQRFLVVYPNRDYGRLMWRDLERIDEVDFIEEPLYIKNLLLKNLFRFHFSFRINNIVDLPFKRIWDDCYCLMDYSFNAVDKYFIIFTDSALGNYRASILNKIKRRGDIVLVLTMINSFNRMKKIIQPMLNCFDKIYTFDREEAQQYGFEYYPTVYSKIELSFSAKKQEIEPFSCFFVGVAKDRLCKLINIYDKLEKIGAVPCFFISGVTKYKQKSRKKVTYNKWLPYSTVLKKILASECIVEIMDKNNAGVTLRTLEAICYNKKLVTNNRKILESPFYNSDYIFLLDQNEDITMEFFEKNRLVEYRYDERYSPILFIKKLKDEIYG